jgi:hypothetical protein
MHDWAQLLNNPFVFAFAVVFTTMAFGTWIKVQRIKHGLPEEPKKDKRTARAEPVNDEMERNLGAMVRRIEALETILLERKKL